MRAHKTQDGELEAVAEAIKALDPDGSRIAGVLRNTLDQLYDGQRTGRYKWDQLFKTEKTHCGTLVEINLQREFKFEDGTILDYTIAGTDVDCKYSQTLGGWMIPPEALGHVCLLAWSADAESKWSLGLLRITPERINVGANRDRKATLNAAGRQDISWIFDKAPLPPNILLQLPGETVERIMSLSSGQKRVNEIFRVAFRMRVGRAVVATLGQQDDYMKRVRENGGARSKLRPEGIVIFGQYKSHCAIAEKLGVPEPGPGESISVRLVSTATPGPRVAEIEDKLWRVAHPSEPVETAPKLPKIKGKGGS